MRRAKLISWSSVGLLFATNISSTQGQQPSESHALQPSPIAIAVDNRPRYILQRQDVISLTFPLSPELNQSVTIQPDGYINLQNFGGIYVQGLTVPELVLAVRKAYTGILHDPLVDADLQDFQKPLFTVSGQVGKPGQYELRSDIKVSEALAVAGGMTMLTAKTQVFLFHRSSKDWVEVKKINVRAILNGKALAEDAMIQPGDLIYVPEKFITNFKKYIPYSFNLGTYINQGF